MTDDRYDDQDVDGCHHALTMAGVSAGALLERVEDIIAERDEALARATERVSSKVEANRAVLLALFRELLNTGTCLDLDFSDEREPSVTPDGGSHTLSVAAIKLLTGEEIDDGDIDACRRAGAEVQGRRQQP